MEHKQELSCIHPLLQEIIGRIAETGVGEVLVTPDGHLFLQTSECINALWGALDMKKEGQAAGVRVVVRKVRKRAKRSKYKGMPWMQIYVLPIVKKNASTMTEAERQNMEKHAQVLRMAHAVERDPELAAHYHELHEAHKRNPQGYKKLYPNFFGFLVATFRMEMEAEEQVVSTDSEKQILSTENTERTEKPNEMAQPIRLQQSQLQHLPKQPQSRRILLPHIRLPMVA